MTARDTPSDLEAMQRESAAELERRANELARLEALTQSWDASQLGMLSAIKTGIEQLNAEAMRRLIRALKSDEAAAAALCAVAPGGAHGAAQVVHFVSPFARQQDTGLTDVCALVELVDGAMESRLVDGRDVLLYRHVDQVSCLDNACAHKSMQSRWWGRACQCGCAISHGVLMVAAASPDSLHVSLAPAARLAPEGAATELGQADFDGGESNRGSGDASASTLFWPYCVAWDGANLCVADAGNNRLMLWHQALRAHNTSCDVLVGQAGSQLVEHNQGSYYPDAACLNMPYGGAVMGQLLVVADTANSRLLAWRIDQLKRHGVNAVALAAQADWNAKGDNRWRPAARDSVCWPYSVAVQQPCTLLVADSGNNRVLMWPLALGL